MALRLQETTASRQRKEASDRLTQHFLKMKEGEFISYQEIRQGFGLDIKSTNEGQSIRRAMNKAMKQHGLLVHTVRGMGLKVTTVNEINGQVDDRVQRTRKAIRRTTEYVNKALDPNYYNRLDTGDKRELYRKAAILGALDLAKAITPPRPKPTPITGRTIQLPEVPA